jgi:hypothetical protein
MKRPLRHPHALLGRLLIRLREHVVRGRDRGANVVETIIIVAGFAILAAAIYAAVSGKVHTWITKIP